MIGLPILGIAVDISVAAMYSTFYPGLKTRTVGLTTEGEG